MARRTLTLDLPDELYERIKEEAEASQRPVEDVAVETLNTVFPQPPDSRNLDEMLSEMQNYSDAQLQAVVRRRLAWMQSLRLRELSLKGKSEALSADEEAELNALLELVDRQMLLRSEALLLLKERGQNVEMYAELGA